MKRAAKTKGGQGRKAVKLEEYKDKVLADNAKDQLLLDALEVKWS